MRIAIFLNQFPLVSETFILQQIQGALARGHQVDIHAVPVSNAVLRHPILDEWKMEHRLRPRPPIACGTPQGLAQALRTNASPALRRPALFARCVFQCLQPAAANPLALFSAAMSAAPSTPARYDVIHAHFADSGLLAVRLRALGVLVGPILTSFHGNDVTQRRSARKMLGLQRLFAEGDAFTHPSDYLGRRARALGCPEVRQWKHSYGIDPARFTFSERTLTPGCPVHIISIARLVEKKGLSYAIAAVAALIRAGKNVRYNIIGDGPLRGALEAQIAALGAESRIHLLGARDGEAVRQHLREAHIFVLPSVTAANGDMEGLPVSILEAQMSGLPVVSTLHSGIPEGVQEGRSAFLVKERDAVALAERLGCLADHPETWASMGRAGREFVEARFHVETLNDQLVELYRRVGR